MIGSRGRKSIVLEEESEGRRRSSRIIAQRERENESKELERQNNYSANNENRNDGKEKETTTTDVDDHSMPHCDTEQHSPAKKKGRKYKALNQLMISSSTQVHV